MTNKNIKIWFNNIYTICFTSTKDELNGDSEQINRKKLQINFNI